MVHRPGPAEQRRGRTSVIDELTPVNSSHPIHSSKQRAGVRAHKFHPLRHMPLNPRAIIRLLAALIEVGSSGTSLMVIQRARCSSPCGSDDIASSKPRIVPGKYSAELSTRSLHYHKSPRYPGPSEVYIRRAHCDSQTCQMSPAICSCHGSLRIFASRIGDSSNDESNPRFDDD
ncbi:hypothetical protein OBBRIDRAFT_476076 [Obba rivulosa]|uniref:Uncharacterized protein n=1 Tax=Obba rivulosa TaxID=1052685 RepID=A0A8E2B484_9APHY|nr:hypothetical protein OBBRIDRAFT_476076 [Obba rivulosa]